MFDSRPLIALLVLAALILGTASVKEHRRVARDGDNDRSFVVEVCTNIPWIAFWLPLCPSPATTLVTTLSTSSPSSSTSAPTSLTSTTSESTSTPSTSTTSESILQNALWCQFRNGTYLPRNYTYFRSTCSVCRCTDSRAIRCTSLQCLPAYCVDDSMPKRQEGQCCAQCSYEEPGKSCFYDGINYPHGTILKYEEPNMQCWCQMGNIECRVNIGSMLQGLSAMAEGVAPYVILLVLFCVFFFGLMVCCSCTLIFYYYYQRHQASFEQAYDEYVNNGGWQLVEEDQVYPVDEVVDEKLVEAENGAWMYEDQPENAPPLYSAVNNS